MNEVGIKKIKLNELRMFIFEAMISELAEGLYIEIEDFGRSLTINILKEGKSKAHSPGWINMSRRQVNEGLAWEINNSNARSGYGPLLYDLAMEVAISMKGGVGITSDSVDVSNSAIGVWEHYFMSRPDVKKIELPTYAINKVKMKSEALRYYYYKVGTPLLDKLHAEGKIVMKEDT